MRALDIWTCVGGLNFEPRLFWVCASAPIFQPRLLLFNLGFTHLDLGIEIWTAAFICNV